MLPSVSCGEIEIPGVDKLFQVGRYLLMQPGWSEAWLARSLAGLQPGW